jgi:DNA-binding NtrC family response regulator
MDKKRILIVDDESHIRLALSRLLSKDYAIFEESAENAKQ